MSKKAYFLGIGGIGMSALARFYAAAGYLVWGYDLTATPLTDQLIEEGMTLHFDDSEDALPKEVIDDKSCLVIYTPAIPKDHPGFLRLQNEGFEIIKRSVALGRLAKDYKTLAISGTHGKTTTSAFAAHILKESSIPCISFVGGILAGYERNILSDDNAEYVLVEADEFDRSFLQLDPYLLGVTSIDADHLDIYDDKDDLTSSFQELASKESVRKIWAWDGIDRNIFPTAKYYGFEGGEIQLESLGNEGRMQKVKVSGLLNEDWILEIPLLGKHNALNAILAASICLEIGCDPLQVKKSIAAFRGVKRRFEYIYEDENCTFIDDYAHHPKEIDALIQAVRSRYPEKKITAIFQPHLFSRTRDFMDEFAESLSHVDELFLLDIYPAREKPILGITSQVLLEKVQINEKSIVNKENLPLLISSSNPEILLTVGAGDIAQLIPAVKQSLSDKNKG